MWHIEKGALIILALVTTVGCSDATSPPESLLQPEHASFALGGFEGATITEPGFFAYAVTKIWGTGVGYNIQASLKEYADWSILRESWPAEEGVNFNDITSYDAEVRAGFDSIYVCGRRYDGWHRWEYWNEAPWTSPGAVRTGTSGKSLPACDCNDDPRGVDYDPYADGGECATSGSGSSTATYSEPYDGAYTGGQTVDFDSGMPDGGTSICGSEAVLAYVCVDITYEDGTKASKCGWATTC